MLINVGSLCIKVNMCWCSNHRLSSNHHSLVSCLGEPSAPKLQAKVHSPGNSLKINWITQDNGGSKIKHYLIRYKAVSISGNGGNFLYASSIWYKNKNNMKKK